MIYRFFIFVIGLFLSYQINSFGKEVKKTGTTSAKFLSIGVTPRANAMGGAFTAVANDASSLYWNPAGIALSNKYEGIFTYKKLFADINLNFLGLVIPLENIGNFGLSVTSINYGEMEVTTEDYPEGTGEKFSSGSYCFALTYARNVTDNFVMGMNIKYVREDISNSNADGICFDIGTIFTTPFYGIKFASSVTNYGTKMQITGDDLLIRFDPDIHRAGNNQTIDAELSTDKFELPLRLQIGISKDFSFFEDQRFTLAIDATHPNDNEQSVNIGGELSLLNEMIFLRAGYKSLLLENNQEGLTFGVGLNYNIQNNLYASIDYAYQSHKYLDNIHSFGLLIKF